MLGRDEIGDRHGLLRRVGDDHHAARPRVDSISARRASATSRSIDAVTSSAKCVVPGDEPGEAVGTVLGLQNHIDGAKSAGSVPSATTTTSDGPAKDDGTPTVPRPPVGERDIDVAGPTMTSTGRIDSVPCATRRSPAPADRHDLVAPAIFAAQHDVGDLAIRAGRDTHDDLFNARHPRRYCGHEHGRGIDGPTPGT